MMMVHFTTKNTKYTYTKKTSLLSKEILDEMTGYVFDEKGEEVISERHQKDFKREFTTENGEVSTENFTDINFDDI